MKFHQCHFVSLDELHLITEFLVMGFPGGSGSKELACYAGDLASTPGSERSPEEGSGNPLQYSCLENSTDRGAQWALVHEIAESWT